MSDFTCSLLFSPCFLPWWSCVSNKQKHFFCRIYFWLEFYIVPIENEPLPLFHSTLSVILYNSPAYKWKKKKNLTQIKEKFKFNSSSDKDYMIHKTNSSYLIISLFPHLFFHFLFFLYQPRHHFVCTRKWYHFIFNGFRLSYIFTQSLPIFLVLLFSFLLTFFFTFRLFQ